MFTMYNIVSLWKEIVLLLLFQSECLLFTLLAYMSRLELWSKMLNRGDKSTHLSFLDLSRKSSSLSPLVTQVSAVCFLVNTPLSDWKISLLFLVYWVYLSWKDVRYIQMLFLDQLKWWWYFFYWYKVLYYYINTSWFKSSLHNKFLFMELD